jgi:ornithine cyclodeaminase/alanine dehydrogenase-like protein (mu-crystallin family)
VNEIPVIDYDAVLRAVTTERAIERVRDGFIRYAKDEWTMPPKVYLDSSPHGDFRAMPAAGDGIAILKWVTSFPSNSARDLPTVTGTILVSEAETGRLLALVDGRSVTALRTGAAAAIASQALESANSRTVGLIGCGLHGRWAGACLKTVGYEEGVCADVSPAAARAAADELGWSYGTLEEALHCDVITLVTPGYKPVMTASQLRPGAHINALGADGPGKAEMTVEAVNLCELYCDEWRQASHGGELTGAFGSGLVAQSRVTELGAVLTGQSPGRTSEEVTTLFDSTGLAIQDLAIVKAVLDEYQNGSMEAPLISL